MSKEQENKAVVGRWFKEFWGNPWNPKVVDNLAAPDILLQYSLHAPRRGRDDVRAFMMAFREALPDLGFAGTANLIARATLWSDAGKAAAPTRGRRSVTFSPGRCRRAPAGGCDSAE
jgi:SnoaL-like polyketide cyclase